MNENYRLVTKPFRYTGTAGTGAHYALTPREAAAFIIIATAASPNADVYIDLPVTADYARAWIIHNKMGANQNLVVTISGGGSPTTIAQNTGYLVYGDGLAVQLT